MDRFAPVNYCADAACGGTLRFKSGCYRPCNTCNKVTCTSCKVQHEGESCEDYKKRKDVQTKNMEAQNATRSETFQSENGLEEACAGGLLQIDEVLAPEASRIPFIPGDEYMCAVDGCEFTVRLHEGSTKFWCPVCHKRHRIEGDELVRVKKAPSYVQVKARYDNVQFY